MALRGAWSLLAVAALAAAALPTMAQQDDSGYHGASVDLTLYGHLYDVQDVVPMTSQPMDPQAPDLAAGTTEPTIAPQYGAGFNQVHFFNSMGPVEYNASLNQPRIHPERGLALPLQLDASKDVKVYWYMSADDGRVSQVGFDSPAQVGALPHLIVHAEVRLGNDLRKELSGGDLIAAGDAMVDLITPPGGPPMEIQINLGKPALEEIAQRDSFNLGVSWYQLDANGEQVLAPGWTLHTGPNYPNRLVLPVKNPIYVYFVEPQFQGDRLAVNAAFNSPLGNYDVDAKSLQIEIHGPNSFHATSLSEPVVVQHTFQHNEHQVATLEGWLWDYKADHAPPGNYTVVVRGSDQQHLATAEKSAVFTLEEQGKAGVALDSEGSQVVTKQQLADTSNAPAKKTPGLELGIALMGVAAVALAWGRRQGS